MDTTTFDGIARNFGSTLNRRSALRGLFAGAAALVAGGAVLHVDDASAKRRRKKNKKTRKNKKQNTDGTRTLPIGAFCENSAQCPSSYICEVAVNAGNSDRTCCGAQGAGCGAKNEDGDDTAPYCCVGHQCVYTSSNGSSSWTCQAVPDEI
jgi:hypothetical protein